MPNPETEHSSTKTAMVKYHYLYLTGPDFSGEVFLEMNKMPLEHRCTEKRNLCGGRKGRGKMSNFREWELRE